MIVKLNKKQFDYLDNSLSEEQEALKLKLQVKKTDKFIFIDVDENVADEIRDWAMDKQVKIGFDLNYELTTEGRILDELMDVFFTG